MESIRRETRKLRKKVEEAPRVLTFRGRRVVHHKDWKYGDWSKFPDKYIIFIINPDNFPRDWFIDYIALLDKLQDPAWGNHICWSCVVHQADDAKKEIDRFTEYWEENGGKAAKEQNFREMGEKFRLTAEKAEALRDVEWRVFNELGEANNRTCEIVNYFKCPYGEERKELIDNGQLAYEIWEHIKWYDRHWNNDHSHTPSQSESKWYHYNEPSIMEVTSLDDIIKAMEDGRFGRIVEEHERYMKETGYEIWAV